MKIQTHDFIRRRGFTLTELLVVVVILVVLAALAFLTIGSFRKQAWAAESAASLRQCAAAVHSYLADQGRYPECYDFANTGAGSGGGAWTWQIRDHLGYSSPEQWPAPSVLHPRHGKKGLDRVPAAARNDLHHFAASAIVLQDVDENNPNSGKRYIRPSQISDPTRIIMLGDAPLKSAGVPASGCHAGWWSLRFAAVQGAPEQSVSESVLRKDMEFWLRGKAQFVFVDGHVEVLSPSEIKKRHFQL